MRAKWYVVLLVGWMCLGLWACPIEPLPSLGQPCFRDDECSSTLRCLRPCPPKAGVCLQAGAEPPSCAGEASKEKATDAAAPEVSPEPDAMEREACKDGDVRRCSAPSPGPCPGQQRCQDGAWGACATQTPHEETCDGVDDDCDGQIDEGLAKECYGGPDGTKGIGACKAGKIQCVNGRLTPCTGAVTPKVEDVCNAGTDDNCDGMIADPKDCSWALQAHGTGKAFQPKFSFARALAIGKDGSLYVTGVHGLRMSFGRDFFGSSTLPSLFVAKVRPSGAVAWVKTWQLRVSNLPGSGGHALSLSDLAVGPKGQLYLAGVFGGTLLIDGKPHVSEGLQAPFVFKLSAADGAPLWFSHGKSSARVLQAKATLSSIAIDSQGQIHGLGAFFEDISWGGQSAKSNGSSDLYVVRLNADGTAARFHVVGGKGSDRTPQSSRAIALGPNDEVFLLGRSNTLGLAGTYTLALGQLSLASEGAQTFVAALSPKGMFSWAKTTSGAGAISPLELFAGASHVVAAGLAQRETYLFAPKGKAWQADSSGQGWVAQFDLSGSLVWQQGLGGAGASRIDGGVVDAKGRLFVSGGFSGALSWGKSSHTAKSDRDGFVALLDAQGEPTWIKTFGNANSTLGSAVAVDNASNVFVLGTFSGLLQLDGMTLRGTSSTTNMFLWKMISPAAP